MLIIVVVYKKRKKQEIWSKIQQKKIKFAPERWSKVLFPEKKTVFSQLKGIKKLHQNFLSK